MSMRSLMEISWESACNLEVRRWRAGRGREPEAEYGIVGGLCENSKGSPLGCRIVIQISRSCEILYHKSNIEIIWEILV
jgi:hypothetical protein